MRPYPKRRPYAVRDVDTDRLRTFADLRGAVALLKAGQATCLSMSERTGTVKLGADGKFVVSGAHPDDYTLWRTDLETIVGDGGPS